MEAVKSHVCSLEDVSKEFESDRKFVMEDVKSIRIVLKYASKELQNDYKNDMEAAKTKKNLFTIIISKILDNSFNV